MHGEFDNRGLMGVPNVCFYFEKAIVNANVKTNKFEGKIKKLQEKTDRCCSVYTTV